jgi:hypothetical protein
VASQEDEADAPVRFLLECVACGELHVAEEGKNGTYIVGSKWRCDCGNDEFDRV